MTFSVIARDEHTGQLGVGVSSCVLAVGRAVPWATAGVGVAVTQSMTNRGYGPYGLAALESGVHPGAVIDDLLGRDPDAESRQVALLGTDGRVAAHTGTACMSTAGHRTGPAFSVQGNTLTSQSVLDAMADAYLAATGPLAERLIATLDAGQDAGGDLRGRQSAALLVVDGTRTGDPWDGVPVDLRVDHARNPVGALRRLLGLQRAYESGDPDSLTDNTPGPRELYAALDAAKRGDLVAAKQALARLRAQPGWDEWLRSNLVSQRMPHLAELLD